MAAATKAGVDATTPAFGNELLLVAGGTIIICGNEKKGELIGGCLPIM